MSQVEHAGCVELKHLYRAVMSLYVLYVAKSTGPPSVSYLLLMQHVFGPNHPFTLSSLNDSSLPGEYQL